MPDYTDLKRRLMEAKVEAPIMGSFTGLDGKPYKVAVMEPIALAREAAAAIAALEAERDALRVALGGADSAMKLAEGVIVSKRELFALAQARETARAALTRR